MSRTLPLWALALLLLAIGGLPAPDAQAQNDVPEVVRDLLEQGERLQEADRTQDAITTFLEAIRLGPGVVEPYLALGALYHRGGRETEALATFEQGLHADPGHRRLLFNAAVLALRLEQHEKALGHVEKALQGAPKDADLLSLEAAVLQALDRPRDALASLLTASKRKSGDPQILFRLGNLYAELGRNADAIKSFRKAIQRDPQLLRAYYNLGAVLFQMERFDEALEAYEVALEPIDEAFSRGEAVEATHALAYGNLGAIHFHKQQWTEAAEAYSKALQLDPERVDALYNLGFLNYQQQRYGAAAEAYEKALDQQPDLPLACFHLGLIRHRQERHREAIEQLQRALPKISADDAPAALWALAQSQRTLSRLDDAEASLRRLLTLNGDHLPAQLELARLLRSSRRIAEARQVLQQAEAHHGEDLTVLLELAGLARLEEDRAAERDYYERVLTAGETSSHRLWPARLRLLLMLLEEGDVVASARHSKQLSRLVSSGGAEPPIDGPQKALIETLEGVVQLAGGRSDAARRRLQAAVAGGSTTAAEALLLLRASEGETDAVLPGLEASDVPFDAVRAANLAQVLWLGGRRNEARPLLLQAVSALESWPSLHAALGELELEAGRIEAAQKHLRRAADLCRDHGGQPAAPPAGEGRFSVLLGGDGRQLCRWIDGTWAIASIQQALQKLSAGPPQHSTWRTQMSAMTAVLAMDLRPADRATARFVRGSARLSLGVEGAREDLQVALESPLPHPLRASAFNNLAIAWLENDRPEAAEQTLRRAVDEGDVPAEVTLHLGIVLDQHLGRPQEALAQYDAYLATSGATRRQEVAAWVQRLRRIYP